MKYIWLTDIHLNFLYVEQRVAFYEQLKQEAADAIFITGDIADAVIVGEVLQEMYSHTQNKIYFVLGNHDYYKSKVSAVRDAMSSLCENIPGLIYLTQHEPVFLSNDVCLLGVDGWADGRLGDYVNSPVVVNDSNFIEDLYLERIIGKYPLLNQMQMLADKDAKQLSVLIQQAVVTKPQKIVVLTHVPPFAQSCWHRGKLCDKDFLPFFSSHATGQVLTKAAQAYPEIQFLVLCGHTHAVSDYEPMSNLRVKVGAAEYRVPVIQETIDLSEVSK
jgi:predicted phosphohydrolase